MNNQHMRPEVIHLLALIPPRQTCKARPLPRLRHRLRNSPPHVPDLPMIAALLEYQVEEFCFDSRLHL